MAKNINITLLFLIALACTCINLKAMDVSDRKKKLSVLTTEVLKSQYTLMEKNEAEAIRNISAILTVQESNPNRVPSHSVTLTRSRDALRDVQEELAVINEILNERAETELEKPITVAARDQEPFRQSELYRSRSETPKTSISETKKLKNLFIGVGVVALGALIFKWYVTDDKTKS